MPGISLVDRISRWSRWSRRGRPRFYHGPEVPDLLRRLGPLMAGERQDWRNAPPLAETYFLPAPLPAREHSVAQADEVIAGTFRVASRFPPENLGFPPRWDADPIADDNWLSSLQGLEWMICLFHAHASRPDSGYLKAAAGAIEDWILRNPFRSAPSPWSWHDHAAAKRLRLFAWFWEHYRTENGFDPDFARLLSASVYQHAAYHMDRRNYRADSNHGLEAIGSLLAAALTFPMFQEAESWRTTALDRLQQWIRANLSPEGFHLEQSPAYHWLVLLRLAAIDRFITANGRASSALSHTVERAARVWPHLLKPDRTIPTVGDSVPTAPSDWQAELRSRWGREIPPPAESCAPPGSPLVGEFVLSSRAGYAVFRTGLDSKEAGPEHTYLLFRCHASTSPHCHHDALSFVLHGLGRDWIVDPGYLNYHEGDPCRRYLRSPRAHSLVVARAGDSATRENGVLDWGRTMAGDYVVAFHDLPRARHTRCLLFAAPDQMMIEDQLHYSRKPVLWCQLFQIAPGLEVQVESPSRTRLIAPDGSQCAITQSLAGKWETAVGQTQPRLQGWYSAGYGQWEPCPTLIFHPPPPASQVRTELTLHPEAPPR